jgi:hypothetical protein
MLGYDSHFDTIGGPRSHNRNVRVRTADGYQGSPMAVQT